MRLRRRFIAVLMVVGLAFGQIVAIAHACPLLIPRADASTPVALTVSGSRAAAFGQLANETMPSDCAAMAKRVAANAKVCESHCTYGQQIDVQPDAPVAAIAPQPALTVRVMSSTVQHSIDTIFLHARSTAPPVSLLFSRLLI